MHHNSGVNKVLLLGKITADEFVTEGYGEQACVCFTISTSETIKRAQGNIEHIEFHKVRVPQNLLSQEQFELQPGRTVYLEGRLQTTGYIDARQVKRYSFQVVVNRIEFLR